MTLLAACRDTAQPFDGTDDYGPRIDTGSVQLTYNTSWDHVPVWSGNADTVYYSASSFPGLPIVTGGVLLAVPRRGGTARILLPAIQVNVPTTRWLTTPAVSRNSRIALFELNVFRVTSCTRPLFCTLARDTVLIQDTVFAQPELVSGRLRVRDLSGNAADVASKFVPFPGREGDDQFGGFGSITILTHYSFPFQRKFNESRIPAFRPTWSPDGNQLVFSNGVGLFLWTPPQEATRPIAGSEDGLWPAWSPDGTSIAFTRFARTDSVHISCNCFGDKNEIIEIQNRTVYRPGTIMGMLVVMRIDGTGLRELGEGEAPAWLPDGSALIARRGTSLWRIPVSGSAPTVIPNTQDGNAPAVSPDGKYLAFARQKQGRNWDIWVIPLNGSSR